MRTRVLYAGPHLRATVAGDGPRGLVVTFDHWRARPCRVSRDAPPGTFVKMGFQHLRVLSAENDWFLNTDLAPLLTRLHAFSAGFPQRLGLGFSMGGYGLLLASRVVAFDRALFVSPQTTFAPDLPRGAAIGDLRFPPGRMDMGFAREAHAVIRATPPATGEAVVVFDPTLRADARHAEEVLRAFRTGMRVALPGAGHPVSRVFPAPLGYRLMVEALLSRPFSGAPLMIAHNRLARIRARATPAPVFPAPLAPCQQVSTV